jgi:hypothetical protein
MDIIEKLLNKTSIRDDGCWMFLGAWNSDGYGNIRVQGKLWATHRLSYELFVGPIPNGISVLHHCDNPWCINPEHLFLGTQLDNVRDMIAKGRSNFTSTRLLTDEQVIEIRRIIAEDKYSLVDIGKMFGIRGSYVWAIKYGVNYK